MTDTCSYIVGVGDQLEGLQSEEHQMEQAEAFGRLVASLPLTTAVVVTTKSVCSLGFLFQLDLG